jgi:hypothetical protein
MTQFPVKEIQQFTIHHNAPRARCIHKERRDTAYTTAFTFYVNDTQSNNLE